jgi:hypothetical protein
MQRLAGSREPGLVMRLVVAMALTLLGVGFAYPPKGQPSSTLEPASFVAPQDKALVVFVRPARFGKATKFYIFDENRNLLTLLKGNEHVTIEVAPGKHTFYIVSGSAGLVRAELAARRTYVVYTPIQLGFPGGRGLARPVLRDQSDFAESAKWIRDTKRGEPDFSKANRWVKKHQDKIRAEITDAEAGWLQMDEKTRSSITLRPEDGRTPDEASEL